MEKAVMELQRDFILQKWNSVTRPGVEDLVNYLMASDFFVAPCSTVFHLSEPGGLAKHSKHVFELLAEKIKRYNLTEECPEVSVIICALGHDLCKTNFYIRTPKWTKENNQWIEREVWTVNDELPLGHGEKSLSILQDYIMLTPEEKKAIRWHMVAFDPGIHFGYPSGFPFQKAIKDPLATLLFTADFEASNILEA